MHPARRTSRFAVVACLAIGAAACGGSSSGDAADDPSRDVASQPPTASGSQPGGVGSAVTVEPDARSETDDVVQCIADAGLPINAEKDVETALRELLAYVDRHDPTVQSVLDECGAPTDDLDLTGPADDDDGDADETLSGSSAGANDGRADGDDDSSGDDTSNDDTSNDDSSDDDSSNDDTGSDSSDDDTSDESQTTRPNSDDVANAETPDVQEVQIDDAELEACLEKAGIEVGDRGIDGLDFSNQAIQSALIACLDA
ncbi:MAG: hypothetical protein AAGC53_19290 [Actinomycetota bacterium]